MRDGGGAAQHTAVRDSWRDSPIDIPPLHKHDQPRPGDNRVHRLRGEHDHPDHAFPRMDIDTPVPLRRLVDWHQHRWRSGPARNLRTPPQVQARRICRGLCWDTHSILRDVFRHQGRGGPRDRGGHTLGVCPGVGRRTVFHVHLLDQHVQGRSSGVRIWCRGNARGGRRVPPGGGIGVRSSRRRFQHAQHRRREYIRHGLPDRHHSGRGGHHRVQGEEAAGDVRVRRGRF